MTLFPQTGTTAVVALAFSGSALADDTILSKWSGEYSAKTGTKLDYQPIGSGRGIVQIKASAVDFGASDAPLKPEDLKNSDLGQFPRVIGGIVPVVNIEGVNWPESSAVWRYQARSGRLASRTRQIYLRRADLRCRYCYPRLLASPHGKCRLPPTRSDSTPRHRACCSPARLPRRQCGAPLNCPCRRASPQFRFEQAAMAGLGAGGRLRVGQRIGPARLPCHSGLSTPIYTPTAGVAMTVLMLTADDPRATDAFDTAQVRLQAKG